jgi:hypothetical protein
MVCKDGNGVTLTSSQGLTPDSPSYDDTFFLDPEGNSGEEIVCDTDDLTCKVFNAFKALFVPDISGWKLKTEELKNTLANRSPFAYLIALSDLNFSVPDDLDTAPPLTTWSFAFSDPALASSTEFTLDPPTWMDTAFSTLRTALGIGVWLGFIAYLFLLYRRVLPSSV